MFQIGSRVRVIDISSLACGWVGIIEKAHYHPIWREWIYHVRFDNGLSGILEIQEMEIYETSNASV